MKPSHRTKNGLNRRHWLVLTGAAVTGCGGGGTSTGSLPGTGGTGLFAMGSISGFGSVIINGIKFDDTQASVRIDGQTLTPADLRLGMIAGVQGQRNGVDPVLGTALGTATAVEVWSIALGPVSAVNASSFSVMGMHIQIDNNTSLDGLHGTTPLTAGQTVAVWGLACRYSRRQSNAAEHCVWRVLQCDHVVDAGRLFAGGSDQPDRSGAAGRALLHQAGRILL